MRITRKKTADKEQKTANKDTGVVFKKPQIDDVLAKVDAVKQKRIVKLRFKSCCGCGCNDLKIEREVDGTSKLQDGDYIHDVLDTDNQVGYW